MMRILTVVAALSPALACAQAPLPSAHYPYPAPVASTSACGSCATCAAPSCGPCKSGWSFGGRLKAWFGYKDCGECPKDCHACKTNCSTPLYKYFLRDCAYRPSACVAHGCGGDCGNAVNPPYAKSIFPVGHYVGAMPTGHPGGCPSGGCR